MFVLPLVASLLLAVASGAPVDPEDEVELITPSRVPSGDNDYPDVDGIPSTGGFPIIIVRGSPARPSNGFPFFNLPGLFGPRFPFGFADRGDEEEQIPIDDDDEDYPIFGSSGPAFGFNPVLTRDEDSDDDGVVADEDCGLICLMFKHLETQIRQVQEKVDEVRRRQQEKENEVDDGEGNDDEDGPVHNSTYTEKVLPDGTVVKINRTVISDSSDDGSGFFFHSTSFHNVLTPDQEQDGQEQDTEGAEYDGTDVEQVEEEEEDEDVPLLTDVEEAEQEEEDNNTQLKLVRERRSAQGYSSSNSIDAFGQQQQQPLSFKPSYFQQQQPIAYPSVGGEQPQPVYYQSQQQQQPQPVYYQPQQQPLTYKPQQQPQQQPQPFTWEQQPQQYQQQQPEPYQQQPVAYQQQPFQQEPVRYQQQPPARYQQQQQPFQQQPERYQTDAFSQQEEQSFRPSFAVGQARPERLRVAPSASGQAPPDLSSDTRVNDILSENARRGGLILIDPESELVTTNERGRVVPLAKN